MLHSCCSQPNLLSRPSLSTSGWENKIVFFSASDEEPGGRRCLFGLAALWGFVSFVCLLIYTSLWSEVESRFGSWWLVCDLVAVLAEEDLAPRPRGGNHSVAGAVLQGEFLSLVGSPVFFGSLSPASPEALAGIELEAWSKSIKTTADFARCPLCAEHHSMRACSLGCVRLCDPVDCSPPGLPCAWNFPGKNTVAGSHFLLQGIFLTHESNPHLLHLLHWQVDSLPLCHLRNHALCMFLCVCLCVTRRGHLNVLFLQRDKLSQSKKKKMFVQIFDLCL